MPVADQNRRLVAAAERLREAQRDYLAAIANAAEAERLYKLAQAKARVMVDEYRNADDREAQVETLPVEIERERGAPRERFTTNMLRYAAHLAEGERDAAKQAVANYRQELSALMSIIALERAEAEFERWRPRETPDA